MHWWRPRGQRSRSSLRGLTPRRRTRRRPRTHSSRRGSPNGSPRSGKQRSIIIIPASQPVGGQTAWRLVGSDVVVQEKPEVGTGLLPCQRAPLALPPPPSPCLQAALRIEEEARQHFAAHLGQHGDRQPCCGTPPPPRHHHHPHARRGPGTRWPGHQHLSEGAATESTLPGHPASPTLGPHHPFPPTPHLGGGGGAPSSVPLQARQK